jgi:hypothetical protein
MQQRQWQVGAQVEGEFYKKGLHFSVMVLINPQCFD